MSLSIKRQIIRGLGLSVVTIVLSIIALIIFTMIKTPSNAQELTSRLGPGRIIECHSERKGMDGYYWARYECDPESVRERIKALPYQHRAPSHDNPSKLVERFLLSGYIWPAKIDAYTVDWIEFDMGNGNYMMICFPDDNSREVFYLKWDV